jgi:hypothetical protein
MTALHPIVVLHCEDERRHGVGKAVISSSTEKDQTEGKPVLTRDILFGITSSLWAASS